MYENLRIFNDVISGKRDEIYDIIPVKDELGDFKLLTGINVIINSIKTLLLTPLGYYPFDPSYGSLLYKQVFEPADQKTIDQIKYEVTTRIRTVDDRVIIEKIETKFFSENKGFQVDIYILRNGLKGTVNITLSKNNMGAFAEES